jgi:hypothetical protein
MASKATILAGAEGMQQRANGLGWNELRAVAMAVELGGATSSTLAQRGPCSGTPPNEHRSIGPGCRIRHSKKCAHPGEFDCRKERMRAFF